MSDLYRKAERMLYDYPENMRRLSLICELLELYETHGDFPQQSGMAAGVIEGRASDRVNDFVHKKLSAESERMKLEENTRPVTHLLSYLSVKPGREEELKALRFHYFGDKESGGGGIEPSHLYRLRRRIVRKCMKIARGVL